MAFTRQELAELLLALDPAPLEGLQVLAAAHAAAQYYPHIDPSQPVLLVGPLDERGLARVQEILLRAYPSDHSITVIAAGQKRSVPLETLAESVRADAQLSGSLLSGFYAPPLDYPASFAALQDVAARLRSPEGCPWDRALTWAKLRASLLEESHELLAALDAEDAAEVAEELGDLLLQIALQTQIAAEAGAFHLSDVIRGIVSKLIRRHPHVFGDVVVSGTDEVLANWEAIKAAERERNGEKRSALSGIPAGLPALAQADAYLDRVSRLKQIPVPDAPCRDLAEMAPDAVVTPERVGQALFSLVAWARDRGVDAESALRAANARYATQVEAETHQAQ